MVKLSLISPKGNQGVRYFPYQGYLGLTPLRFEGLVRTQIEQDGKCILAKDITIAVRCYESRHGRLGTVHSNVLYEYSVTLWQKQDAQEWSEVGNSEHPFRFSLPSHIAAPSTALYFQEYRIFWRIEAVLNHVPIPAIGSRQIKCFELPLVRYDAPVNLTPPTPSTPPSSSCMTLLQSKARGLSLRYCTLVPPNPIGPLDIVTVQLVVQPLDPSVSIRSASAFVERKIRFSDFRSGSPESPPGSSRFSYPPPNPQNTSVSDSIQDSGSSIHPGSNSSSSQDLPYLASSTSVYSGSSSRPLLQYHDENTDESIPPPSTGRETTHIFAHAESAGRFSRNSSGVWQHKLTFSWPDTKSNSRWAVGESVQAGLACVKFFLRVKLIVSSPTNSAETIELEDKELTIVSTNDLQRQLAVSRYSDWLNTTSGRSKSKSPRHSKRDRQTEQQLPSPPRSPRQPLVSDESNITFSTKQLFPLTHNHKMSTASSPYPGGNSGFYKASRRPYTSAGPQDRSNRLDTRMGESFESQTNQLAVSPRPETAYPTHVPKSPNSRTFFRQRSVEPPRLGTSSSSGHGSTESSQFHSHASSLLLEKANLVDVQAWEQELARIESASRRNSAVLSQRKKAGVERPSVSTYLHVRR